LRRIPINAAAEAYPDLSGLDSYDKVIAYVQDGRAGFRNKQSKLRDRTRAYEAWKDQGFVRPVKLNILGFPSSRLQAKTEDGTVSGAAALAKMRQLIITEQADTAYRTGRDQALTVPAE
jgi:hypothetical protein